MKLIQAALLSCLSLSLYSMQGPNAGAGNPSALASHDGAQADDFDISSWFTSSQPVEPITYRELSYLESLFNNSKLTLSSVAKHLNSINVKKNSIRLEPFLNKYADKLLPSAQIGQALENPTFEHIEHVFTCFFILAKISEDSAHYTASKNEYVHNNEQFLRELLTRGLNSCELHHMDIGLRSCKMLQCIARGEGSQLLEDQEHTLSERINPSRRLPRSGSASERNSEGKNIPHSRKPGFFSCLGSPKFVGTMLAAAGAIGAYFYWKRHKENSDKPGILDFALSRVQN